MSVRAYKIISKEIESEPSFNLWHDDELLDFFEETGEIENKCEEGGGTILISVKAIKKALRTPRLWVGKDDYRFIQLRKDVKGMKVDEWVEYECW